MAHRQGLARLLRLDASQADGSELLLLALLVGVVITMLKGEPVDASLMPTDTDLAMDGDAMTRWSPLEPQRSGQTLELDLGRLVPGLSLLRLASGRQSDQPSCLQVSLSRGGTDWIRMTKMDTVEWPFFWNAGRALDSPYNSHLGLGFTPQKARYVRLVQACAPDLNYWSTQELRLYQTAPAGPAPDPTAVLVLARKEGVNQLHAEAGLAGFVPRELQPRPQASPRPQAWPLILPPRSVLPSDLTGVMVAVEAHDVPRLIRLLGRQGAA